MSEKKKPKLDMDKIAKGLGAAEHFPLETPVNPLYPDVALAQIRRKRAKGNKR